MTAEELTEVFMTKEYLQNVVTHIESTKCKSCGITNRPRECSDLCITFDLLEILRAQLDELPD